MRKINGYVFIPRFKNNEITWEPLFGPNTGKNGNSMYDNFENNGMNAFEKYEDTISSSRDYLNKISDCLDIGFGRIKMEIAESEKDLEDFRKKSSLIVIMKSGDMQGDKLLGPYVDGKPGFGAIPGGFLCATNFETYTFANSIQTNPFERAKYLASEVHRQGQCGTTIAKFNLTKFKGKTRRK